MVPKLVAEDIPLLFSLLNDVFPNVGYTRAEMKGLKEEIRKVCAEEYLVCGEGDEQGGAWMEKVSGDFDGFLRLSACILLTNVHSILSQNANQFINFSQTN
jgi:Hydrolytic ATP binding site of dynein motor region